MKYSVGALCAAFVALVLQFVPHEARPRESARNVPSPEQLGANLQGRARVIDGDTIEIAGERVRLEGIDAPEIKQSCQMDSGQLWPAGSIAAATLERWVRHRSVTCRAVGRDSYDRLLGRCTADGIDLNGAMIKQGLAWAFRKYSQRFVADERVARTARRGIWAAACEPAWAYRANRWSAVADNAPRGCAIKGNITRNGRIYHMPWNPWYGRTRIEPGKGERWFCNERQALAAGWRPAIAR